MTKSKFAFWFGVGLCSLFAVVPSSWAQEDGAALYKANCQMCHKADGSGNPGMKSPAVKGKGYAEVKKAMTGSPKHATVSKKLNDDQLKAIGEYLKGLK